MKTKFYAVVFVMFGFLMTLTTFGQYNPLTNDYSKFPPELPVAVAQEKMATDNTTGVPCTDNSFWAVTGTGLDLYSIAGGTVTFVNTTTIAGSSDVNLAYCNNLNGGAYSPTFYMTLGFHQPTYFDGTTTVVTPGSPTTNYIMNPGGYGNYLYYQEFDSLVQPKGIMRYDGTSLTEVHTFPAAVAITVADLAVDSLGYCWFFTGPNDETLHTDTLNVMAPNGQFVHQYPFAMNTLHGYGCFLSHGKLYIGLGASNPDHPNTIIPIILTSGTPVLGTPMAMPATKSYSDMASCATGAPLSAAEHQGMPGFRVFPNPMGDQLFVTGNESTVVSIYDATGREVMRQSFSGSVTLNTEALPQGIYVYKIRDNRGVETTGKVVK